MDGGDLQRLTKDELIDLELRIQRQAEPCPAMKVTARR
jgi:hypothetical protein